jgi:hypothetical protein
MAGMLPDVKKVNPYNGKRLANPLKQPADRAVIHCMARAEACNTGKFEPYFTRLCIASVLTSQA